MANSPAVPPAPLKVLQLILENPALVQRVQSMPPSRLLLFITETGLEDSSALLAVASPEQLVGMLDEDLWKADSLEDGEKLDLSRLHLWFEVLAELPPRILAQKLIGMNEELLCHLLSQSLWVINMEYITMQLPEIRERDLNRFERILENHLAQEFDEFRVIAKSSAPWDSLLALLLALESEDWSLLARLLARLCDVTTSRAETIDELSDLLSDAEMLENDAAHSREIRRTAAGFVTLNDAKAFLDWIHRAPPELLRDSAVKDPVSEGYFRLFSRALQASGPASGFDEALPVPGTLRMSASHSMLLDLAKFRESAPEFYAKALEELHFLAQVWLLREGEGMGRYKEAVDEVLKLCAVALGARTLEAGDSMICLFRMHIAMRRTHGILI